MNLDTALLVAILFFAALGAVSGAARQIAQIAGGGLALALARPLGERLAPYAAQALGVRSVAGSVVATIASFVVLFALTRAFTTWALQRLFAGGDPRSRALDRLLGFVFAGLKVALFVFVVLCALTFVEEHVAVAGKRLGLSPKGSVAFSLARRYNVFELARPSGAKELAVVVRASGDPKRAPRLLADPKYQALHKDERFRRVLGDPSLRRALDEDDLRAALSNPAVQELLADPRVSAKIRELAAATR